MAIAIIDFFQWLCFIWAVADDLRLSYLASGLLLLRFHIGLLCSCLLPTNIFLQVDAPIL